MAFDRHGLVRTALEGQIIDRSCGVDSGKMLDALEDLIEELRLLCCVGELSVVDHEGEGEDVVLVESRIDGLEIPEAAQHESGADEKNKREGNFDDDQAGTGFAGAAFGVGMAQALFEGFVDVSFGHAPGGKKAGDDSGEDGESE